MNPPFFKPLIVASLALSLAAAPFVTHAERADRKQKVNVSSIESDGDYGKGVFKLSKNVLITQGTLKLSADRADIRTDDNEQYKAVLTAKPVCFQQRADNGDWTQGVSERVEYDSSAGIVELFGNAILFVGEDETRANYIVYNTQAGTYEARDSKDRKAAGKGVTFVLQPREKDEPVTSPTATSAAETAAGAVATPTKPALKAAAKKAPTVKTATPPKRNEPAFSRCA
jgi:lipopolysaccharide export system protein LptA